MSMCNRIRCLVVTLVVTLSALAGIANAGDYAPYSYGNWTPVGPGNGINIQCLAIHPVDANVIVCNSDASGMHLTCDRGATWIGANKGLISQEHPAIHTYRNGPPNCSIAWDPVDPNYIYFYEGPSLWCGSLCKGDPGSVKWTLLNSDPNYYDWTWKWGGFGIVFDPDPDPNGVGRAQFFYMINRFGYIFFTNDGGAHHYKVGRIPGHTGDDYLLYEGGQTQKPLLAIHPAGNHDLRLISVACPKSPFVAFALHKPLDPNEPNWPAHEYADPNYLNDPNYLDNSLYWAWDDPNDPCCGLPTSGGANGILILDTNPTLDWADPNRFLAILACDDSGSTASGLLTRGLPIGADWASWAKRGDEFDLPCYLLTSPVVHPADPNIAYVVCKHGDNGFDASRLGVNRTRNLLAPDPNDTSWECITRPENMTQGHLRNSVIYDGCLFDLSRSDPNIMFFSNERVGLLGSHDGGANWSQSYTNAKDANSDSWRNRGLSTDHAVCITLASSDPNKFYVGFNDYLGMFKTDNQGESFRKSLLITGDQETCAPTSITYCSGGLSYAKPAAWFYATHYQDPNWWVDRCSLSTLSGVVHPKDPNRAWFIIQNNNRPWTFCGLVLRTSDGGQNYTIVQPDNAHYDPNHAAPPKVVRNFLEITATPDGSKLYLASGSEGILVSTDAGDTWSESLDANDANVVNRSQYDSTEFSYGHNGDPNYPAGPYFLSVDVADSEPNIIYATSGYGMGFASRPRGFVYKSQDGGRTWTRTAPLDGSNPRLIVELTVHPTDPNTVYAVCYRTGLYDEDSPDHGIYKTTTGGASWTRVFPPSGKIAYCRSVTIDPWRPNVIYCSTNDHNTSGTIMTRPGIYVSRDDATTWQMLDDPNRDDPNDPAYSLSNVIDRFYRVTVHPRTGDVYVGSTAGAYWWPQPDRILRTGACADDPNDANNIGGGAVYMNGQLQDANNPWQCISDKGTQITLNAVADANHYFVTWVGDLPAGADPCDPQLVVTMDIHRKIWAGFGQDRVLTAGACFGDPNDPNYFGGGTVELNGEALDSNNPWSYTCDNWSQVTLAAVGDSSHTFVMWLGDVPAGQDPCNPEIIVPMHANRSIWAGFGSDRILTGGACEGDPNDANNLGGGTVLINGEAVDANNPWQYACGDWAWIVLDAVESPPHIFVNWIGDVPDGQDPCDPQLVMVMDTNHPIWAVFRWPYVKGGASKGDPNDPNKWGGGSVYLNGEAVDSNNPWYCTRDEEEEVTLNAVANANYTFVMWLGDVPSGVDPCDPQLVVPMNTDRQIWAGFGLSRLLKAGGCKDDPNDPNNIGGGTVQVNGRSIDANNPWIHAFGDWAVLRLTALKNDGQGPSFTMWYGSGVPGDQDANLAEIFVTMDTDREIWAVFHCGGSGLGLLGLPLMIGTSCGLLLIRLARRPK